MERANPDPGRWLKGVAQRSGLLAFWRWWLAELAPLMPTGLRTALRRRRLHPIVAVDRDVAVLWAPRLTNGALAFEDVARIPLQGDAVELAREGRAAIDALPRANGGMAAATKIVIALPANQVLRKSVTLPAAVEENLHQTLAYDLDRHTPFKSDEVYFDAVVVGRDAAKKEIRVELATALKSSVDQARRRVEAWGAQVIGVSPDAPSAATALAPTALNLLPPAERPTTARWRQWQTWVPTAALAIAALVVIALPIWQKRVHAILLAQLVEQAKVQADASAALRDELERLAGDYDFALQRKYAFPAALQVVEDVTKILPDDTWLTQLELKTTGRGKDAHREIVLRGESANAGHLVSLLEDSKVFEQAAPRSPTTKIQPGPGEIFDLGAQLKTLALPQTIQLADMAPRPPEPRAPPMAPGGAGATPPSGKAADAAAGGKDGEATPAAKASVPAKPGEPAAASGEAAPPPAARPGPRSRAGAAPALAPTVAPAPGVAPAPTLAPAPAAAPDADAPEQAEPATKSDGGA
jgi:general secretion pathway protein L